MEIEIGDQISALNEEEGKYMEGRVYKIKQNEAGETEYFISFLNINKRFDNWLTKDQLDLRTLIKKSELKAKKSHGPNDITAEQEESLKFLGLSRNIEFLRFGDYLMKAWYFSPFPEPYFNLETIYCCEFCMHFFATEDEYNDHCMKCTCTHPPGDEIYRKGHMSAYEVDGAFATRWCTNLCLITKLFLFHKTEYYNPTLFHFYVVCFHDSHGAHPCGFFSKEKDFNCPNNLACILAFPCYQGTGVGRFLIQLSYELSKIEHKPGGPETPLSDLGMLAYESYWKSSIMKVIIENEGRKLSITDMVELTGMTESDIKHGIASGGLLARNERGEYCFAATKKQVAEYKAKENKRKLHLDPRRIRWTPYPRAKKEGL
ncbi:MOZ/SAS family protein [Trichomonas vaginalis G3]|uniref:histone acetyltransferase n=1 Tax=Trichomonas vaginalis (strain ATCC PRA-98 / G3) TaxID=412133 RepID=A2F6N9_TRIV3|nr:histone acetyltransferase protein [Trichomonas vaginalis G3]EAX99428.1 MOZ/SAS family protein [Trichomonas vaginalis G3]KAI5516137.1 histone acetyltransferase protein [Trichomonas vaginalis G3]|eukprot:XP_001312358.1 MOZ/SAS family protein [Trichomonas vaginalis G3]